ncbi:MAG TPA: thermonuclease family protein [Desulfuromonadaceae bacterium]
MPIKTGLKLLLICLVLLLLSVGNCLAARTVEGVVRKVYDGDTILLATREESRLKLRLYGIDAPETVKPGQEGQPFGEVSKRTLMYKIMGRSISAEIVDIDQYHRAVAVIRYSGRDINREMVAEGLAWAYRQYLQGAYTSEYITAEESARARHKGLWRDANPTPPWEFRQALKKTNRRHRR